MRHIISIFLFTIMLFSVAAPIVEQLYGKAVCEMKDKEDKDEKDSSEDEKEIKIEKETYVLEHTSFFDVKQIEIFNFKSAFVILNDKLLSELYSNLPKLPPESARILPLA
jgi:DNA polymerase III delta subunit